MKITLEPIIGSTNNQPSGAGFTPITLNINFFTGTASGWVATGALSPNTGNNTTRDYGVLGSGIGLRALNPGIVGADNFLWNATASTGASTGGDTGVFPDAVLATSWFASGTNIGRMELYNVPNGTYTLQMTGSRGSIVGPRPTRYRVNVGSWQSINVANNTSLSVTFTGISPASGVITVDIQGDTPTDSQLGYINGLKLTQTA